MILFCKTANYLNASKGGDELKAEPRENVLTNIVILCYNKNQAIYYIGLKIERFKYNKKLFIYYQMIK